MNNKARAASILANIGAHTVSREDKLQRSVDKRNENAAIHAEKMKSGNREFNIADDMNKWSKD